VSGLSVVWLIGMVDMSPIVNAEFLEAVANASFNVLDVDAFVSCCNVLPSRE
jgi:hypothetical protein